jgi:hypothetical protein
MTSGRLRPTASPTRGATPRDEPLPTHVLGRVKCTSSSAVLGLQQHEANARPLGPAPPQPVAEPAARGEQRRANHRRGVSSICVKAFICRLQVGEVGNRLAHRLAMESRHWHCSLRPWFANLRRFFLPIRKEPFAMNAIRVTSEVHFPTCHRRRSMPQRRERQAIGSAVEADCARLGSALNAHCGRSFPLHINACPEVRTLGPW